eukprot:15199903-Heterocapsa_arctica.AAC.1
MHKEPVRVMCISHLQDEVMVRVHDHADKPSEPPGPLSELELPVTGPSPGPRQFALMPRRPR